MARGQKTGGRTKGIPNKATVIKEMVREGLESPEGRAAVHEAVQKLAQAPKGAKKGLDMLRELATISHALVALHQPKPGPDGKVEVADHAKLQAYLNIAVRANSELASFESPKFKSITLPEIPPLPPEKDDGKVASTMKKRTQQDAAEVYMRIVRGGKAA